jgi:hypothetical protein
LIYVVHDLAHFIRPFTHRAFKALLRSDKETYGDAAFIESEVGSELQVMVDEHISNAS